jgi:gliding motility-associated-like protein
MKPVRNLNYSIPLLLIFSIFMSGKLFAQQPNIIYVTPTGNGAGTQASPTNLANAVASAGPGKQIRLASGVYYLSNTINMVSNLTLEGGYDATSWCKNNTNKSVIYRDSSNILTTPNRLVAISCVNINNFYIHDLDIITANAVGSGVTNYGIYVNGCSDYSIVRCRITVGNGSNGADGTPGTNGANGAPGAQGGQGDADGPCCTAGGIGGNSWSAGANKGGNGGNGGARGGFNSCPNATAGQNGSGAGAGIGGNGGLGSCNWVSTGCDAGPANHGQPGTNGTPGVDGGPGLDGTPSYAAGFFVNGDGQNGQNGISGGGGGGGGGGGSQGGQPSVNLWFVNINYNGAGPGGGGGGEGGQGGIGAGGGAGGGGSFGVFSWNNGTNGKLIDCDINSGLPGIGGLGSLQGGLGGNGGAGNPVSVSYDCDLGNPGRGGNGGKGGNGGIGGNGSTGLSLAVYEDPAGNELIQSTMQSPVEPSITVCELGCTKSEITLSTNAFGYIQWFFDGGTQPLIATGNTVTVSYSTIGRHTVTLVVNGLPYVFSEFVGIFQDGTPYTPQVNIANDTICPGGVANFQSSYAGLNYNWTFNGGNPATLNGPGNQNANVTYPNAGIYPVVLQTNSMECGWSVKDTAEIHVLPTLTPQALISTSGSSVCTGDDVTMGVTAVNGGNNPQFTWFVNNVNTGSNGPVFNLTNVQATTTVTAQLNSSYPCPAPNPITSLPVVITVNPQPTVACAFVGNYLGANTTFLPTPSGGTPPFSYNWDFGDGGISTDSNAVHMFSGTGTYNVTLTATDAKGCQATCNLQINIVVAPIVNSVFTINAQTACGSTTVNFSDLSTGNVVSWFWNFGDGNTSVQQNPVHVYNSPGTYNVYLVAGNGVNVDTTWMPNAVTVDALPTAGINAVSTTGCQPFNVQFQDASIGATSWLWDFGDGSATSTLQNPSHIYTNPGQYTVTLTAGNAISGCTDTQVSTNYITVLPSPDAEFSSPNLSVCTGQKVNFTDLSTGGPVLWNWDFGDLSASALQNPSHVYTKPGVYWVSLEVTGSNPPACTNLEIKPLYITVNQSPVADFDFTPATLTLPETQVNYYNQSSFEDYVRWFFSDGKTSNSVNPVMHYKDSGIVNIMLVAYTNQGCRDTAYRDLIIFEQQILYVPNTFTPDGDQVNDMFTAYGKGLDEYRMQIFDRWGNSIYITDDMTKGWNGNFSNGKECQQGVYTYIINYKYYTGFSKELRGSVLLLR